MLRHINYVRMLYVREIYGCGNLQGQFVARLYTDGNYSTDGWGTGCCLNQNVTAEQLLKMMTSTTTLSGFDYVGKWKR